MKHNQDFVRSQACRDGKSTTCERCHDGEVCALVCNDHMRMYVCIACAIAAMPFVGDDEDQLTLIGGVTLDAYLTSVGGVQ